VVLTRDGEGKKRGVQNTQGEQSGKGKVQMKENIVRTTKENLR